VFPSCFAQVLVAHIVAVAVAVIVIVVVAVTNF
jgi:hypothetical protein